MFRTIPAAEPTAPDVADTSEQLVALSVLRLDFDAPPVGTWEAELVGRGVQVVRDDLARPCISREDARRVVAEREEAAARRREVLERQEQQAIEADRQWREQLSGGIPWWELPLGVSAAEVWAQAEKDAHPRRSSLLEDALEGGSSLTFHPLSPTPGEES